MASLYPISQDPATLELVPDYKKQSYKKFFFFFSLKTTFWPRSNDTPVAMNTHSTQIMVSNIILQQKEQRRLGEMADSRTRGRKYTRQSGVSSSVRKIKQPHKTHTP